jgi:CheY-like chemotaxis protein
VSTVLVVDDEPGIRDVISTLLKDEGYDVLQDQNGAEALELLPREQPDLVVLDIMMPLVDGREVLRRLRAMPELEATHVILMSAGIRDVAELQVAAFLRKPFDIQKLLGTVRQLLQAG